jgi:hypothetical protein
MRVTLGYHSQHHTLSLIKAFELEVQNPTRTRTGTGLYHFTVLEPELEMELGYNPF